METTKERIEKGIIKLEDGKLTGLGVADDGFLEVSKLDDLLDNFRKADIAQALDELILSIGSLGIVLNRADESNPQVEKLRTKISQVLPNENDLFLFHSLAKLFK